MSSLEYHSTSAVSVAGSWDDYIRRHRKQTTPSRTLRAGRMDLLIGAQAIVIALGRRVSATDVEVRCARGEKPKSVEGGQCGAPLIGAPDVVAKR